MNKNGRREQEKGSTIIPCILHQYTLLSLLPLFYPQFSLIEVKHMCTSIGRIRNTTLTRYRKLCTESYFRGHRRVKRYVYKYRKQGYDVEYSHPHDTGVDIKCWMVGKDWDKDIPDIVLEITNYSQKSFMSKERAERYVRNLLQFPNSRKIIVVSFSENIKGVGYLFRDNGITIQIEGYQN